MSDELLLTPEEKLKILKQCRYRGETLVPKLLDEITKAQLAKAKQHYEQKDRTNLHEWGSPKGLPGGWRGRILRGSSQKRLDRPDREKIAEWLQQKYHPYVVYSTSVQQECLEQADQILALIEPLIEEAKKQERERIIKWLRDNCYIRADTGNRIITREKWQALKEEKEEV